MLSQSFRSYGFESKKSAKKILKNEKKDLQLGTGYGIIIKHVTALRYALKQKVAVLETGNFCGACPILNRAKFIQHNKPNRRP